MAPSQTTVRIEEGVARVRMDDGKVNALSSDLIAELQAALDEAEKAGAIVVLEGRAGIFSAGFDLKTFARGAEAGVEMVFAGARLVERMLAFPHPIVTACAGHAYPAGAFLMMAADVRFGVRGDFQIGMNEVAIGLTVPKFAIELARHRLTPPGFARITTAAMFSPEEAREYGYLDSLVEAEALGPAVEEEVARLRALDRDAYVGTKARVHGLALEAIRTAIEAEGRELGADVSAPAPPGS